MTPCSRHWRIVGAGDVVSTRMLPAIRRLACADRLTIYHDGISTLGTDIPSEVEVVECSTRERLVYAITREHAPIIVATPPGERLAIANAVQSCGMLALEKPICADRLQLERLESLLNLDRVFALSYYAQEKALAWSWLNGQATGWKDSLELDSGRPLEQATRLHARLGELVSLEIVVREGNVVARTGGSPPWYVADPRGVWVDMGIHVVMMILAGVGERDSPAMIVSGAEPRYRIVGEGASFALRCEFGKGYAACDQARWLRACYDEGEIEIDLATGRCRIRHSDGSCERMRLSSEGRYETMMRMLARFFEAERWPGARDDMLGLQLLSLRWLLRPNDHSVAID